ncbi:VWA domain-containing protein [uncultured Roseovarius sp.]|uniref:VWA domain-containing protein n=1 Tax=uncultured Roseovarius sp. TaxID=293344 RepID=UPI0026091452|nr:VWA domain-containing protein [uncultured Roseovarius sp.]
MKLKKLIIAAVASLGLAGPSSAAVIDIGFALDQSGSVGSSNFNLVRTALANALDQIPTSGPNQYRIGVVKFNSFATNVVSPPTIVTAGNIAAIKNTIATTSYSGGGTSIAAGVTALTNMFTSAGLGDMTLFNVTTDGQSSISALQAASTAAAAAGVDGISYEGIGGGVNTAGLLSVAFPTPAVLATLATIPDPTKNGFVLPVASFADYEAAIKAKVQRIVTPTIPLPAGLPLILSGVVFLGGLRAAKSRKAAA